MKFPALQLDTRSQTRWVGSLPPGFTSGFQFPFQPFRDFLWPKQTFSNVTMRRRKVNEEG